MSDRQKQIAKFVIHFVIGFFGWYLATFIYWYNMCKQNLYGLDYLYILCVCPPTILTIVIVVGGWYLYKKKGWRLINLGIPAGVLVAFLINVLLLYYFSKDGLYIVLGEYATMPFYFYLRSYGYPFYCP